MTRRQNSTVLPLGLDPVTRPIIARHIFGWRFNAEVAAHRVGDLAFQRQVERLHQKGARVICELLTEIGAERGIGTIIDQKVERYVSLPDETLEAVGGDRFPCAPLHEVTQ